MVLEKLYYMKTSTLDWQPWARCNQTANIVGYQFTSCPFFLHGNALRCSIYPFTVILLLPRALDSIVRIIYFVQVLFFYILANKQIAVLMRRNNKPIETNYAKNLLMSWLKCHM